MLPGTLHGLGRETPELLGCEAYGADYFPIGQHATTGHDRSAEDLTIRGSFEGKEN